MGRRVLASLALTAAALTGCGGDDEPERARGEVLTVYASLPAHGTAAAAADAAWAGARRALADAGGRAGRFRVRLVRLSSTRPGDEEWDAGTVEANAERAAEDPSTIAYLGELDAGGSSLSLPVTNRRRILQVAVADGLTSLTARPPGRPRAGPERYYPEEVRTFARLVATDEAVARELLRRASGVQRPAILSAVGIADRELAGMLGSLLRRRGREPVAEGLLRDEEKARATVEDVLAERPDAIFLTGARKPEVAAAAAAVGARAQAIPVFADGGLPRRSASATAISIGQVLPVGAQPPRARRLARSVGSSEAAMAPYAYAAMELVLDAVAEGAPEREAVRRAALEPGVRETVLGPLRLSRRGDAAGSRLAVSRPAGGSVRATPAGR